MAENPPPNEPSLPEPPPPPQTAARFEFTPQINVLTSRSALDGLAPDQIMELAARALHTMDEVDKRRHAAEMERIKSDRNQQGAALILGSLIALIGLLAGAYLAMNGQSQAATTIFTSLAVLVAVVIGRKTGRF